VSCDERSCGLPGGAAESGLYHGLLSTGP